MARLISLNQTTALVSSSSCNNNWTPKSVDTWKTPLRLDLTAAHSIVAPFKSTHNSGLLVPVDDPAAVVDIFALHENWKFKLMKWSYFFSQKLFTRILWREKGTNPSGRPKMKSNFCGFSCHSPSVWFCVGIPVAKLANIENKNNKSTYSHLQYWNLISQNKKASDVISGKIKAKFVIINRIDETQKPMKSAAPKFKCNYQLWLILFVRSHWSRFFNGRRCFLHYRRWTGLLSLCPSPTHTAPNITKQNQSGRETERRGETYDIKICQVITYDATPLQIRPLGLNIAR